MNLIPIFLTGLFAGALTCLAVQGGLLAATIAQREEERLKNNLQKSGNALPILSFLISKLIAYTILGFFLGLLGSFFRLSITASSILNLAVAIFMIGTALNILNVHPIFRYFVIQPPHFLARFIRKQSKRGDIFAPAILGAFTIFIPCGTTQAMMALSIASGSGVNGALILFAFVLGTSPLFFILGYFATRLGDALQQKFMRFAAIAIIILALFNINNSLALAGFNLDIGRPISQATCILNPTCFSSQNDQEDIAYANDSPVINIEESGYTPSNITLRRGSKVTLKLNNVSGGGCTQSFTIPSLGIQRIVPLGSSDSISFTAPDKPGQIAFMCGMGMFRGLINVI